LELELVGYWYDIGNILKLQLSLLHGARSILELQASILRRCIIVEFQPSILHDF
jgi:hypothetical protein